MIRGGKVSRRDKRNVIGDLIGPGDFKWAADGFNGVEMERSPRWTHLYDYKNDQK
jgi:hypothetical protein